MLKRKYLFRMKKTLKIDFCNVIARGVIPHDSRVDLMYDLIVIYDVFILMIFKSKSKSFENFIILKKSNSPSSILLFKSQKNS